MYWALAAWLKFERDVRRIAPRSFELYVYNVRKFGAFLKARGWPRVTPLVIDAYLGELTRLGASEHGLRSAFKVLRAAARWGLARELIRRDPMAGMRAPIVHDRLKPSATREEFVALFKAIRRSGRMHARRDAAILACLWYAGLRIGEAVRLRLADLDAPGRALRVLGKGSVVAELPVHPQLDRVLARWLNVRPQGSELLFPSKANGSERLGQLDIQRVELALRKHYLPLAGLKGLTPHAFRRGIARRLKQTGAPISAIKAFLRHANVETTLGYIPDTPDEIRGWVERA